MTFNLIYAQEEKESKFNLIGYGGIGYGVVENNNEPNYNLNSNIGEILLNYNINQKFGIATGIGVNELSGNGFNSKGNFYHERILLKVPLLVTLKSKVFEKFNVFSNLGVFGQTIIKDKFRYINNTYKNVYEGWDCGILVCKLELVFCSK